MWACVSLPIYSYIAGTTTLSNRKQLPEAHRTSTGPSKPRVGTGSTRGVVRHSRLTSGRISVEGPQETRDISGRTVVAAGRNRSQGNSRGARQVTAGVNLPGQQTHLLKTALLSEGPPRDPSTLAGRPALVGTDTPHPALENDAGQRLLPALLTKPLQPLPGEARSGTGRAMRLRGPVHPSDRP